MKEGRWMNFEQQLVSAKNISHLIAMGYYNKVQLMVVNVTMNSFQKVEFDRPGECSPE